MKIAAIVITYHPGEELVKNIQSYIDAVDVVIIWRNSTECVEIPERMERKTLNWGDGENRLIAYPINRAIEWCYQNGYDYLLTMDQDSRWNDCLGFVNYVEKNASTSVSIYAPNVNNQVSSELLQEDVDSVITSGSLCNVRIVRELGGFREDYGIYWVDGEFCHWSKLHDYRIVICPKYSLIHHLGSQVKTVVGSFAADYSPKSYYYLFRNMLWMHREYKKNPSIKCILYTSWYYFRSIFFGERKKIQKFYSIFLAFCHGFWGSVEYRKNRYL